MACNALTWLQEWYLSQCNGDWEHQYGIHIGTLDNPGWSLDVDLVGTEHEHFAFSEVRFERSEIDWVFCEVKNGKFRAACGPVNLFEAIELFRAWVAGHAAVLFERRKAARLGK
jgi:hypothetical protein